MRPLLRCIAFLFATTLAAVTVGIGSASAAVPDGYYDQVANELKRDHVYVDPSATKSKLSGGQEKALVEQIDKTGDPIYVVMIGDDVTRQIASPTAFLDGVHVALGPDSTAFIAVGTTKGFYATGYNMKSGAIKAAADAAKTAVRSSDPFTVSSSWTNSVSKLDYAKTSGWKVFGIVAACIAVFGLVILVIALVVRKRRNDREEEEEESLVARLQRRINALADSYSTLTAEGASANTEANAALTQMLLDRDSAQISLNAGDPSDAAEYLREAEASRDKVRRILDGTDVQEESQHYGSGYTNTVNDYVQAPSSRRRNTDDDNEPDTYDEYTPRSRRSRRYPYYTEGGYLSDGRYLAPGYYPAGAYSDPLLTALLIHELVDDDHHHGGDHGDSYSHDDNSDEDHEVSDGDVGGGSWDSSSSYDTDSGGGDWGGSNDDTSSGGGWGSSYDNTSYSSNDNSGSGDVGGGDWGGGSSYDSGGSDFGGGGYDSGGDSGGGW
jgi:uncharacterized membrane protein YgcG